MAISSSALLDFTMAYDPLVVLAYQEIKNIEELGQDGDARTSVSPFSLCNFCGYHIFSPFQRLFSYLSRLWKVKRSPVVDDLAYCAKCFVTKNTHDCPKERSILENMRCSHGEEPGGIQIGHYPPLPHTFAGALGTPSESGDNAKS